MNTRELIDRLSIDLGEDDFCDLELDDEAFYDAGDEDELYEILSEISVRPTLH